MSEKEEEKEDGSWKKLPKREFKYSNSVREPAKKHD